MKVGLVEVFEDGRGNLGNLQQDAPTGSGA
jgi:hypothetical protein